MNSVAICLLLATFTTLSATPEFSLKGDPCSKYDRCQSKSDLKTCSCDSDCHSYGTCCHDVGKSEQRGAPDYKCYDRRAVSPVFVKRSCSDAFKGHVGDRLACLEDDEDEMDVRNNLLVTSRKTNVAYWNKHCAVCNNEAAGDLEYWNIEVFCPRHDEISRRLIRKNLTFDEDKRQWGLMIGGEFLNCAVRYAPPSHVNELKYCTRNLVSNCPDDYKDERVSSKCSQYHAERKVKNSDLYFRNVHCAICNNADLKELECPGMSDPEEDVEETDFRDMLEETFTDGEWLEKRYQCSRGHTYDPTREKCRKDDIRVETTTVQSSAEFTRKGDVAFVAILVAFSFHFGKKSVK